MHYGTLPQRYEPGSSRFVQPDIDRKPKTSTRRGFLGLIPMAAAFAAGAGTVVVGVGWGAFGGARDTQPAEEPVIEGSVAWAEQMQQLPPKEFLAVAGELERVRMNAPGDDRLIEVYVALLDTAIMSEEAIADAAGRIAVRCLFRMGVEQHVEVRRERITAANLTMTLAELRRRSSGRREGR